MKRPDPAFRSRRGYTLGTVPIFRFEKWDCPLHLSQLRRGYTLIELLVATTLTLMMMAAVATIFGMVGQSVNDTRATLEMSDALRSTATRLQEDLEGVTAAMLPPRDPAANEGYFEYIEGPNSSATTFAYDLDANPGSATDTTVIDNDDILMFTTRSEKQPFVGRAAQKTPGGAGDPQDSRGTYPRYFTVATIESQVAEIAWFVRGRTLYRRVLLVQPQVTNTDWDTRDPAYLPPSDGFYAFFDLSVRASGTTTIPNTLSDLTRREYRFAHDPDVANFPGSPHVLPLWQSLGLPTLRECSYADIDGTGTNWSWFAGAALVAANTLTSNGNFDPWVNPYPWNQVDQATGTLYRNTSGETPTLPWPPNEPNLPYLGTTASGNLRVAEDVILNNVIGFDVKAWDPGAPVMPLYNVSGTLVATLVPGDPGYLSLLGGTPISYGTYVDLGYTTWPYDQLGVPGSLSNSLFWHTGLPVRSGAAVCELLRTYDTWSTHYESDGVNQDGDSVAGNPLIDEGTNGFDDGGIPGVVDDEQEQETSPPYPAPLRGIQVKIRVFDPDSRQVREVTIIQDFLQGFLKR